MMNQDEIHNAAWQQAQAGLAKQRQEINEIDAQIAKLLQSRFAASRQIAQLKASANLPVLNVTREAQVLAHATKDVDDPAVAEAIRGIFTTIMQESRALQNEQLKKAQV
ncbi:chorismate mutase [Lacticaseibacillus jixiensis]|uniref:chorismate mutase n=1 Tax=Lacticaseibacillus jixiensis TaxID=3231926 RepID=UPI0036F42555